MKNLLKHITCRELTVGAVFELVRRIAEGLTRQLKLDGFARVADAVGVDAV